MVRWTGWTVAALLAWAVGGARQAVLSTAMASATAPLPGPLPAARGEGVPGASAPTATAKSTPRAQRPPPDTTPPTVPEGLEASATSDREVALHWQPSRDDVGVVRYEVRRDDRLVALASGTGAGEAGLRPAASYCYTVLAHDAAGNVSEPSVPACATTPDLTPPSAPGAPSAQPLGESEVLLSWTPSQDEVGVAGYELVREGRVIAGTPSLAAREKGLRPFTEYCWTVRALDAAGNRSAPSAPACARTPDTTPPSAPQYLAARPSSDRSVELVWRASTDNGRVAGYEVLRDGGVVLQTGDAAGQERELRPGVRYCWTVRARDAAGNVSAESQPACAVPPDLTPPSPPPAVAAAPLSSSAVAVSWEPADDDVGVVAYELVRDGGAVERVSGTEAEATGLAPTSRHCFAVRALDAAGHRSESSEPVCVATVAASQAPPAPRRLRATATSPRAVRLAWEPSARPGVVYRVSWEDGKGIGATRQTTFTAVGLRPGERHCYRVAAVDEEGRESPRTLDACAASLPAAAHASR